ncbi:MAG: hypothetical protein AABN95_16530 [Acidobacteriota bacterium]
MQLPRRGFLKSGALTAVTAGLAISGAQFTFAQGPGRPRGFAIPRQAEESPLFSFTQETFESYLNSIFQAPNARGEMVSLTLVEVRGYKAKRNTRISTRFSQELRSFSLSFTAQERLPQFTSIHRVSHPALGEFDLFLTPHELENGTFTYEAVFSQI